ncbi:MAG TPA: sensor histidine kinase [Hyphomicrobiales bacterium]|nr:sensor histidine kinase [Hyphomicrobiales bacterium]
MSHPPRLVTQSCHHNKKSSLIGAPLKKESGRTIVVINDNGLAIPVEERRNVFRQFHRLEARRSTPGSGLGLALRI